MRWVVLACVLYAVGCPSTVGGEADEVAVEADEYGYAVVGEDFYPPLLQRVESVACARPALEACSDPGPNDACRADTDCPEGFCAAGQGGCFCARPSCASDADCGPGMACLCGFSGVGVTANTCVPAECRTGADCDGACLLSRDPGSVGGFLADHPCGFTVGLVCERPGSLCEAEDWCPGNGTFCAYAGPNDRFECTHAAECDP